MQEVGSERLGRTSELLGRPVPGEKGARSGWCSSGPAEDRVINAKQGLAPTDRDDCNTERSDFVHLNEHLRDWNRLR